MGSCNTYCTYTVFILKYSDIWNFLFHEISLILKSKLQRQWLPSRLSWNLVLSRYPLRSLISLIHTYISDWRHKDTWFENLGGGRRSLQILKLCNWWRRVIFSTLWPLSWQRLLGTHWTESWTPQPLWIWRRQIKLLALARF